MMDWGLKPLQRIYIIVSLNCLINFTRCLQYLSLAEGLGHSPIPGFSLMQPAKFKHSDGWDKAGLTLEQGKRRTWGDCSAVGGSSFSFFCRRIYASH